MAWSGGHAPSHLSCARTERANSTSLTPFDRTIPQNIRCGSGLNLQPRNGSQIPPSPPTIRKRGRPCKCTERAIPVNTHPKNQEFSKDRFSTAASRERVQRTGMTTIEWAVVERIGDSKPQCRNNLPEPRIAGGRMSRQLVANAAQRGRRMRAICQPPRPHSPGSPLVTKMARHISASISRRFRVSTAVASSAAALTNPAIFGCVGTMSTGSPASSRAAVIIGPTEASAA